MAGWLRIAWVARMLAAGSKAAIPVLLAGTMFFGIGLAGQCSGDTPAPASQPASAPDTRPVIRVTNAKELIEAVGSDRQIILAPGKYDLASLSQSRMKHILWEKVHDGHQVVVRGVSNMTVRTEPSRDETPLASILTAPLYGYVLAFRNCRNVKIENVDLEHTTPGFCEGGVLSFADCEVVDVNRCRLAGSGTEGITLKKTRRFRATDCTVTQCTYGIATIEDCDELSFLKTRFAANKKYHGFQISDSADVTFDGCSFSGNECPDESLFEVTSSSRIVVKNSTGTGNTAAGLSEGDGIKFENVEQKDNVFKQASPASL